MTIAAIVVSVLAVAVSGYSLWFNVRTWRRIRRQVEQLATPWPVIEFSGELTPEAEARLRDALAREWRNAARRAGSA